MHLALAVCSVLCLAATLAAADAVVHGVVTDAAGKPVRGAIVKATAGNLTVSAYSQNDGRYELTVPAGTYEIPADAYGFGPKRSSKDVSQPGDTNFSLEPAPRRLPPFGRGY